MLQVKEPKNLVKPISQTYDTNPSVFDIKQVVNADRTKAFTVDFDPVNKIVFLEFNINEDSFLITLDAKQAVDIGRWLLEAGDIVNFIQQTGIQFQDAEGGDEDENL